MFSIALIKNIFVKQLTITLFYTTLTTFLNTCVFAKMTYKVEQREREYICAWLCIAILSIHIKQDCFIIY